jgi:ribonucleoside-diphosphate reductase alpha chain
VDDYLFDHTSFEHACRLWIVVLDISVSMAGFPAREFAQAALDYRTLGLGYANLGGLLARFGLRYDSNAGRTMASGITALMTGIAYSTSTEMAAELGSFPRWNANKESMQKVLQKHRKEFNSIIHDDTKEAMFIRAKQVWNDLNHTKPIRNAQVTLLAPTGTIALIMDCETTGIEPFYSSSAVKNLAGGGTISIHHDVAEEDCAMASRPDGPHLSPMAHVQMVAAVQPFLSGGVSKTINLPNNATIEDVSIIYREANRLGLKSVAIYRDGSKLTQPLEAAKDVRARSTNQSRDLRRGERRELPSRRPRAARVKLEVGGQSIYISTGDHEDSSLGEIFVGLSREGSTVRSMMECFSKAISIGLQYGVPLDVFVNAFVHTKFEPAGVVAGDTRVRICSSLPDLIVRHLAVEYLNREDLASVPRADAAEAVVELAGRIAPNLERVTHAAPKMVMIADVCWECGGHGTIRRTGTCLTCIACGTNSGCG